MVLENTAILTLASHSVVSQMLNLYLIPLFNKLTINEGYISSHLFSDDYLPNELSNQITQLRV
jgi:hypothetical protein